MVPTGNKAKCLLLVSHTTKTIHLHRHHVPWDDIFKISASAAASEFCEWVQVRIDVYIPHCKDQVKPQSSPWFSAASAAANRS